MSEALARALVTIAEAYAAAGLVFSVPFVLRGAGVLTPVAKEGTWGFRILILPGSATLWPYLLYRWVRAGR